MSTCFSPDISIRREDTEMGADLACLPLNTFRIGSMV